MSALFRELTRVVDPLQPITSRLLQPDKVRECPRRSNVTRNDFFVMYCAMQKSIQKSLVKTLSPNSQSLHENSKMRLAYWEYRFLLLAKFVRMRRLQHHLYKVIINRQTPNLRRIYGTYSYLRLLPFFSKFYRAP